MLSLVDIAGAYGGLEDGVVIGVLVRDDEDGLSSGLIVVAQAASGALVGPVAVYKLVDLNE